MSSAERILTMALVVGYLVAVILVGESALNPRGAPEVEPLPPAHAHPCGEPHGPMPGREGRELWLFECPEGVRPSVVGFERIPPVAP